MTQGQRSQRAGPASLRLLRTTFSILRNHSPVPVEWCTILVIAHLLSISLPILLIDRYS